MTSDTNWTVSDFVETNRSCNAKYESEVALFHPSQPETSVRDRVWGTLLRLPKNPPLALRTKTPETGAVQQGTG